MKFSIIIPIYNVEKYLEKCLNSVLSQSYENFEVIMVNDGTKDNCKKIMDTFSKRDKRFKAYNKENGGLSDARNFGLNYATGDYLIFIDSDDYIENDYLFKVNEILKKNKEVDVLRIKCKKVDEQGNLICFEKSINKNGIVTICDLFCLDFFETAWSYVYNLSFWKKNNFKYMKDKIHEDFGLTPEILMRAKKIYYTDYFVYNYVQREGSIMSEKSEKKTLKKCFDILEQYDRLINVDYGENKYIPEYKSYISNIVIEKAKELKGQNFKKYIRELKRRKVFNNLLNNSLKRKIKIILLKISVKLYFKIS
ncbi:MAG: glycosyltransferase [Bacilli bacterium]|nr:glycosyltransferase [Bacilli bacterium]